jgi:GR25 family glycosyltransferase involved in LPS biosynthesis
MMHEAQLFIFTDAVLAQPECLSETEKQQVADHWPAILQNMLVISIREERLERFWKRIGPLRKYSTLIEGINGQELDPIQLEQEGVYRPINKYNELTKGQLGCFMSHRKAWQHIVDQEMTHGFILEDDCEMTPNKETLMLLKVALQEAQSVRWDVLFVGRNPALCVVRKKLREHIVQIGKTWGLFAYVVTREAAQELLAASVVMDDTADCFVSTSKHAAKIKLGISPIPFIVVAEKSDTVKQESDSFKKMAQSEV